MVELSELRSTHVLIVNGFKSARLSVLGLDFLNLVCSYYVAVVDLNRYSHYPWSFVILSCHIQNYLF